MKKILLLLIPILALSACRDIDLCELDHPYHSQITFVPNWEHRTTGVDEPTVCTIYYGDNTVNTESAPYILNTGPLAAGTYMVKAYHHCPKIAVTDHMARVSAQGGYAEALPDWFWAYSCSHTMEKDTHYTVDLIMRQQVRHIDFIVKFEGNAPGAVSGLSGEMTGVAGCLNLNDEIHSDEVKVAPAFTKVDNEYRASTRILGSTGAGNTLSLKLALPGGAETVDCDLSTYMVNFNENKIVPIEATIIVRNLTAGQVTAEVESWEEVDLNDPGATPVVPENQMALLWDGCADERITVLEVVDQSGNTYRSALQDVDGTLTTTELYTIPVTAAKVYLDVTGNGSDKFTRLEIPAKYITSAITDNKLVLDGLYLVFTADDLNAVRDHLTKDHWQMNDIDLAAYPNWVPIGKIFDGVSASDIEYGLNNETFSGQYLGRGHKISNLNINYTEGRAFGLFAKAGSADGSTLLDDIHIESGNVTGFWYAAAICGQVYPQATVTNCTNKVNVNGRNRTGGIVGVAGDVTGATHDAQPGAVRIEHASNSGNVTVAASRGGGILGGSQGNSVLIDCHNTGDITITLSAWGGGIVGGLQGKVDLSAATTHGLIRGCTNTGTVKTAGQYGTAGIAGITEDTNIEDCVNKGEVLGYSNTGGIVGQATRNSISRCRNEGNVTFQPALGFSDAGTNVGGIVGLTFAIHDITECANTGDIYGGRAIGGIAGGIGVGEIVRCYNTGSLTGTRHSSGGIVGDAVNSSASADPLIIRDSYNKGAIHGRAWSGGIIATAQHNTTVIGCYTSGVVDDTSVPPGAGVSGDICWTNNGTIISCYRIGSPNLQAIAINNGTSSDIYKFSAANWPAPDAVNNTWQPAVWKTLGVTSDTPTAFPNLNWE